MLSATLRHLAERSRFSASPIAARLAYLASITSKKAGQCDALGLYSTIEADRGNTSAALAASRRLLSQLLETDRCDWGLLNVMINVLVNGGLYQEALLIPRQFSKAAQQLGARTHLGAHHRQLTHVNLCEALGNLGRTKSALRLLRCIETSVNEYSLAHEGALLLRAWICNGRGQTVQAKEAFESLTPVTILATYAPEYHFTWAAIQRNLGKLQSAETAAQKGLRLSRRASSKRNGLFLLAELALAAGELEHANGYIKQGYRHKYRGQGGHTLRLLAAANAKAGKHTFATKLRRLARERDPQHRPGV